MLKSIFVVLFALTANVGIANATPVTVYEDAGVLVGPGTDANVHRFEIVAPGKYRATLTDLNFPAPAETIGFLVATSTASLGGSMSAGSINFSAAAGTHFINVFGQARGPTNVANYGVQVQALPLPPAAVLFAASMVALVAVGRRRLRGEA